MNGKNIDQPIEKLAQIQLQRILDCPAFRSSPKLSRLLRYLVEAALAGRSERLKAYTIAVDVFEQPPSFDPQTNALVRVQAGRLRNLLERYYLNDGRADPLRIEIPKGGYVTVFHTGSTTPQAEGIRRDAGPLQRVSYGPALAVLPFRNLSGDDRQDYFCDGITQEIIHLLTQCREFHVIAPDSVLQYRAGDGNPLPLGSELGVDYVLHGNVRLGGETARVTACLTDVETNVCVWTQNYDQRLNMENILYVQDDIALRVTAVVGQPHGVLNRLVRRRSTRNLEAYTGALRFYEYIEDFSVQKHARARDALERSIELDPDYAEAWGCLAVTYLGEHIFGFNPRSGDAHPLERVWAAARRAVQLDPGSIIGQYGLALSYYYRHEMALFRDVAERALSLAPNRSDLLANLGLHLAYAGQWERGLMLLDKARVLNPLHPGWYYFPYALDCYRRGQYDEALIAAHKLNLPQFFWEHLFIAMICGQLGREAEGRAALARLLAMRPTIAREATEVIAIIVPDTALVAHCVEGLRKAGLGADRRPSLRGETGARVGENKRRGDRGKV
jgi:TolB-like protein